MSNQGFFAEMTPARPELSPAPGQNAIAEQIAAAVASYLQANPPLAGQNASNAQVADAVAAYLTAHPPAAGRNATAEQIANAVAEHLQAHPVKCALGVVTLTQTAHVAISAGVRSVALSASTAGISAAQRATLEQVRAGDDLLAFPVSAPPAGYAIHHVVAIGAGSIVVTFTAPLLVVGQSFALDLRLVALR